jgi:hypothetical protein
MAIRVIDGVPGSGKSYYAVHHLADEYFQKDHAGFYSQKDFANEKDGTEQRLVISTNLEGLKLPHVDLEEEIRAAGGVRQFFSHEYQLSLEKSDEKRIYIVDEAQRYFRTRVSGDWSDTWFYFEKHRHFGHDVYLLTQNPKKIHSEIISLLEYRIHAKPRVRSLGGELGYQMICDGDIMKRFTLRPKQEVFDLYKSRRKGESEKIKNPIMKTVGLSLVGVALLMGLCYWRLQAVFFSPQEVQAAEVVKNEDGVQAKTSAEGVRVKAVQTAKKSVAKVADRPVKCSYSTIYLGDNEYYKVFLMGDYYSDIDEVPYPVYMRGKSMYAVVPVDEYERYRGEQEATHDERVASVKKL